MYYNSEITTSTPSISKFVPVIPYQAQVLRDVYLNFDYSLGLHEILLSGSVGSAKSILMAHIALRHCVETPGARVLIGRRALPDLKRTIYQKICEHLANDWFIEGVDYSRNDTRGHIKFKNGSEIISSSWADKRYSKVRSLDLSMAIIEELTENNEDDAQAYEEIKLRVGRLPHVKHALIVSATNPAGPEHWAYKYFILSKVKTRRVYYSVTSDNPFLPKSYIDLLKRDLPPKVADRMIRGLWVSLEEEYVYYAYNHDEQFLDSDYKVDPLHPVWLTWDFNIAEGKPLSMACMQYIKHTDTWHIFNEVVIKGARTADSIDELHAKGLLNKVWDYRIAGDATGASRDTRSVKTDYDIIKKALSNLEVRFKMSVPAANPMVRARHNLVNSYHLNDLGKRRLFIYPQAPTADEGFRLTKLRKGGGYIEDDSKPYQHITTAIGYAIMYENKKLMRKPQGSVRL